MSQKLPMKFIANNKIGCIAFVLAIEPVVKTKVVNKGINKFIKLINLSIVSLVIYKILIKVEETKIAIIKYCNK